MSIYPEHRTRPLHTGDEVRFISYGWQVRQWLVCHTAEVITPRTRGGLVCVRLNDADARQYGKPYISVHRECIRPTAPEETR